MVQVLISVLVQRKPSDCYLLQFQELTIQSFMTVPVLNIVLLLCLEIVILVLLLLPLLVLSYCSSLLPICGKNVAVHIIMIVNNQVVVSDSLVTSSCRS